MTKNNRDLFCMLVYIYARIPLLKFLTCQAEYKHFFKLGLDISKDCGLKISNISL